MNGSPRAIWQWLEASWAGARSVTVRAGGEGATPVAAQEVLNILTSFGPRGSLAPRIMETLPRRGGNGNEDG